MRDGTAKKFFGFKAMILLAIVNFMAFFMVGIYGATMSAIMLRLNCSMTVFSSFSTVYILVSFVTSMFAGKIYDKIGSRVCVLIYVLTIFLYVLAMEYAMSIALIYVVCAIYGVGLGLGARAAISKFAAEWFIDRRDEMIGYVSGIYNFGCAAAMLLLGSLMDKYPASVLIIVGITISMVVSIVGWIFMKSPKQMGQQPYVNSELTNTVETKKEEEGVDLSIVLKSPCFWLLAVSVALQGLAQCPTSYMSVVMVSAGVSENVAASLFGVEMVAQCVISLLVGKLLAKVKYLGFAVITYACFLVGLVLLVLFYVGNLGNAVAIITSFILGCGCGAGSLIAAYMSARFFGMKTYGTIMAVLTTVILVGNSCVAFTISPIVTADGGSWQRATVYCIILMVVSAIALVIAALTAPMRRIRKVKAEG